MDVLGADDNLKEFKKKIKDKKIFEISAINGSGLKEVIDYIADILDQTDETNLYKEEQFESYVLYKFKKEEPYTITKGYDGIWEIKGKEVEKLLEMTRFNTEEAIARFANKLRKMGIDDKLVELGVQEGDKVRILDYEFEFR
jgi:GTP-binding protein